VSPMMKVVLPPVPVRLASFSLVAALFISLSGAIPKAADAATEQRRFVAWQDGEPTLRVEGRRNGSCDSSSYKSSRKDAWRCTTGHYLFDPCFENLAELGSASFCAWASRGRARAGS
jgi:hypothetical protein